MIREKRGVKPARKRYLLPAMQLPTIKNGGKFRNIGPRDKRIMPFGAIEEQILDAARNYITVLEKANSLVSQASDGLLSGSSSTVYLKKLGHRPLKAEDSEALINALGNDEDKRLMAEFQQAQQAISDRLQQTKNIGLVLKQAKIPYDQVYKRAKRTDLWKPEQMIQIMEVLRRLQL